MALRIDLFDDEPILLGAGVQWATGDLKQQAITDLTEKPASGANAKNADFTATLVENWSDILRTTNSEARASLGYGVFSASGGVSTSLLERSSAYSIRIAVVIDVQLATITLAQPDSTAPTTNPTEFIATYGTHFVIARQRGASLVAVLSIETSSREERKTIAAQVNASGILGTTSIGGSAAFTQKLQSIVGGRNISVNYRKRGGEFNFDTTDWRTFIAGANGFVGSVTEANSFNRRIWIEGYEYAKGINGIFATQIRQLVLQQQYKLDDLGILLDKLREVQSMIDHVERNAGRFSDSDVARTLARKDETASAIRDVLRAADQVRLNPEFIPTLTPSPPFVPPVESVAVIIPPPTQSPGVVCYTGPSLTGQQFEFSEGSADFPPELNDRMRSFKIDGELTPNQWWITFYLHGGNVYGSQTFSAPITVNVVAKGQVFSEFNIDSGQIEQRRIASTLPMTSSVRVWRNPDTSKRPPFELNLAEQADAMFDALKDVKNLGP